MRTRAVYTFVAGIALLLLTVFALVNRAQPTPGSAFDTMGLAGPATQATPLPHFGPESGAVIDSLVSPDNVTFRIVEVRRGPTRWLFHIHSHNNATHSVSILDTLNDHYFMLAGKGTPGVPLTASQIFLRLTPPGQADMPTHPGLPGSLLSNGDGDGWLVADLTHYKYPPVQLLYVYGTVQSTACASLSDPSTCHPDVGYRTLVWQL